MQAVFHRISQIGHKQNYKQLEHERTIRAEIALQTHYNISKCKEKTQDSLHIFYAKNSLSGFIEITKCTFRNLLIFYVSECACSVCSFHKAILVRVTIL